MSDEASALAILIPAAVALLGALAYALRRWARGLPARDVISVALADLKRDLAEHAAEDRQAHAEQREMRRQLSTIQEARVVEAREQGAALERATAELRRLTDALVEPASGAQPHRRDR